MKRLLLLLIPFFLISSSYAYDFEQCMIKVLPSKTEITCPPGVLPFGEGIFGEQRRKMEIFGTEYMPSQNATSFIQLLDKGKPVEVASCYISIWYPDKTLFIDRYLMDYLREGIYYFDFVVPNELGVYIESAYCQWNTTKLKWYAENFTQIVSLKEEYGDYTLTQKIDNVYHGLDGGENPVNVYYSFYNVSTNVSQFGFYYLGKSGTGKKTVCFSVYNFNTSTWENLQNCLTLLETKPDSVLNTISENLTNYVKNGEVRLRVYTLEKAYIQNDYIELRGVGLEEGWQELRGGGELHVSTIAFDPYVIVEPDPNRTLAEIIGEEVWLKFLKLGTPPHMKSTEYYCKDNTTLVENITFEFCEERPPRPRVCTTYSKINEIVCPYGCDLKRNECIPSPTQRYLTVIGIVAIFIFLIIIFRRFI